MKLANSKQLTANREQLTAKTRDKAVLSLPYAVSRTRSKIATPAQRDKLNAHLRAYFRRYSAFSAVARKEGSRALARGSYTLVEMVVVIGILVLISAIATDMFVNITRSYNKANVIAEIEQSGNAALGSMTNEIRQAQSVSPISGTSSSIDITDSDGNEITFSFVAPTGSNNGYLAREGLPLTDNQRITGVNVTYGMFTITASDPPIVGITMTIAQPLGAPSKVDFQAQTTLKTSVVLRSYQ